MSTGWSVERLDALPDLTVIEWREDGTLLQAIRRVTTWRLAGHAIVHYSEGVIEYADPDTIRVVSVPVDALLSPEAIRAGEDAFVDVTHLAGPIRDEAELVLRAAVSHVTGGRE